VNTKADIAISFSLLLAIVIAAIFLVWRFDVRSLLNLEAVRLWVESFGVLAPLVFMLAYAVTTLLFIPSSPFSVAAGIIFGPFLGTLYVVVGATVGASCAFFLARYFGEAFVERLVKTKFHRLYEYDEKLRDNGLPVVLFLRLVPLFPFNGLNFGLGLTLVSFRTYLLGTLLGIIPGSFVFAYFGSSLASMSGGRIGVAVVLLMILIFAFPLHDRIKRRHKEAMPQTGKSNEPKQTNDE